MLLEKAHSLNLYKSQVISNCDEKNERKESEVGVGRWRAGPGHSVARLSLEGELTQAPLGALQPQRLSDIVSGGIF